MLMFSNQGVIKYTSSDSMSLCIQRDGDQFMRAGMAVLVGIETPPLPVLDGSFGSSLSAEETEDKMNI
jgi:hypothetical protein